MTMANYLGMHISSMLGAHPFNEWPVERSDDEDSDPPTIGYTFVDCGLQLVCDAGDGRVNSIFIERETHAGMVLSEVPFDLNREGVLSCFGRPSKSGGSFSDPVLGEFGAWDSFRRDDHTVHVQYKVDEDEIGMITLMRNDVVP